MCSENHTRITEMVLLGFQDLSKFKTVIFIPTFILHVCTLTGNALIIMLVSASYILQRPMYVFVSNLALADLVISASVVPKMLSVIWSEGQTIPLAGCLSQYFFAFVSTAGQCWILMMMSFDRCLAIFLPLRYSSIMTITFTLRLILLSWFIANVVASGEVILISRLQFCTSNIIDHFFCDLVPLLSLSTTDTSMIALVDFVICVFFVLLPFICIVITYICIVPVIFSTGDKKKGFSTCSSHLILVGTYYGTLIMVYMSPSNESFQYENKFRSLLFLMLTPITNPIIYSLRNKHFKSALMMMFTNRKQRG